ncbi:MULE domain-containing protein [Aphis craccivora]|uniref:MULE domain-containing protein n=1 Tax=Aphis craccivora TaxID=307492 RepID=A0A6G0YWS8_APHCR|nr:MULE domain-containing protein [Aphis craccivora]
MICSQNAMRKQRQKCKHKFYIENKIFFKLFVELTYLNPNDVDSVLQTTSWQFNLNNDRIHIYVIANSKFPPSIEIKFSNSTMLCCSPRMLIYFNNDQWLKYSNDEIKK